MKKEIFWHSLSLNSVVRKLNSDIENGLAEDDVKSRH